MYRLIRRQTRPVTPFDPKKALDEYSSSVSSDEDELLRFEAMESSASIYDIPDYNVQCQIGHVFTAPWGSELEGRCAQRELLGFIDALVVGSS